MIKLSIFDGNNSLKKSIQRKTFIKLFKSKEEEKESEIKEEILDEKNIFDNKECYNEIKEKDYENSAILNFNWSGLDVYLDSKKMNFLKIKKIFIILNSSKKILKILSTCKYFPYVKK